MKEENDFTRIRSCNPVRTSPICYHRAKAPYDVSLLIYGT
jgi:hypothetical protein